MSINITNTTIIIRKNVSDIEEKLNLFYYPLQAHFVASNNEWDAFRKKYGVGRKAYFSLGPINVNGKNVFLRECSAGESWTVSIGEKAAYNDKDTEKYCIVSDKEVEAWVTHISAQYHGAKGKIEDIILGNRRLIKDDTEVKEGIDLLMLHFTGYRDVIKRWESGDRTVMFSHNNFPSRLPQVIDQRIEKLESEIKRLK